MKTNHHPNHKLSNLISCICVGVICLFSGVHGNDYSNGSSHKNAEFIVDTSKLRLMPSTLFGVFFEEINHAGNGGLWAELVYNRGFEAGGRHSPSWIDPWGIVGDDDSHITIMTELNSKFENNKVALRMDVLCDHKDCPPGGVGVYNPGYKGMNLKKGKTYNIGFYVRSENGDLDLTVSFTDHNGTTVLASSKVSSSNAKEWTKKELELIPEATETNGRIQITTTKKGTIWIDQVSAMPADTHKNHGFRTDLFKMIKDLKPKFLRFPGGCFVEGVHLRNAYRWKETVGPWEERPGHFNDVWGYWTDDGLGFLEYLRMAEDLEAEAVWVVNSGTSHKDYVNTSLIQPFVQEMLDSIEFANGKADTKWGSVRAKMGRVEPFNLKYIAIGNEDCNLPHYRTSYKKFYQALKKAYPHIKAISNCDGSPNMPLDHPTDLYDYHIYTDPSRMFAHANAFNHKPRNGPKAFVSEYAVTDPGDKNDNGTLIGALSEAAFLLGVEKNSDVVEMASYAPLFSHEPGSQWKPDAIFFNSFEAYGIPSYWMQTLFKESNGANLMYSKFTLNPPNQVMGSAINYHHQEEKKNYIRIKFVNIFNSTVDVKVLLERINPKALRGSTITMMTGKPDDKNSFAEPQKVSPKTTPFDHKGNKFTVQLPPYSLVAVDLLNDSKAARVVPPSRHHP